MNQRLRANLLLLLTALIWGVAFVAQDVAMDHLPPFTFNGSRMVLGGLVLLPVVFFQNRKKEKPSRDSRKRLWKAGFWCGLMLFLGSSFQQIGIQQTSAGKAGFVTALYIVLVPLLGLFRGKRVRFLLWAAVALCTVGLFLLCVTGTLTIHTGDLFLLLCAFAFAGHILVVDHFNAKTDPMAMSCLQFFICGEFSLMMALLLEKPTVSGFTASLIPIVYAGVFSGGVGYTLQILGQRNTDPTVASLILCLESVFAVLAAWILLGDVLSLRELTGCAFMFAGILLAQLPEKKTKKLVIAK